MTRSAPRLLSHITPRDHEDLHQSPLQLGLMMRLLSYLRPYAAKRNLLFLLVLIRGVQVPLLVIVTLQIINGPIQRADYPGVLWGTLGFLVLAISTQVVMHFRQRWALELGEAVVHDLRNELFAHIQTMPMSWFARTKVGRVISRMSSDVEDIRVVVQDVMFAGIVQLGQMLLAAVCMCWHDALLFGLMLAMAPFVWLVNRHFHRRLSYLLRATRDSFSRVTATLAESVIGVRVTQGFVRQDENARMFHELVNDHSTYNTAVMCTQGLHVPLLELNSQLTLAALLLAGGYRVLAGHSAGDVGDMVSFFFMAHLFFAPITGLGNLYNQAMTAMASAERLFQLLDTPPAWSDPPQAIAPRELRGHVEFDRVTFAYQPNRDVLRGVSFVAKPGEVVALVGQTGSGKTSIINLIAKFYLANRGTIRIDGHDIQRLSASCLHGHLGIVLQQNFLFHGTVADNIRFGRPAAEDWEVVRAVQQLGCLDLITSLRDGFHTRVGERGGSLSAGQRQLICFARALLANPRILILDEATSSIDARTEQRLQTALSRLMRGRTSFVVAHRLSTIQNANQVLVLDQGRLIEQGTHAQLLAKGGVYADLYRQFAAPHALLRRAA